MRKLFSGKIVPLLGKGRGRLFLKAAILAASWFVLPFWLFTVFTLACYCIPLFQPRRLLLPLLLTLVIAGMSAPGAWLSVFLLVAFFLIFGIKDLVLVNRLPAYETLAFLLCFALFLKFFSYGNAAEAPAALLGSFAIALSFFFLVKGMLSYGNAAASSESAESGRGAIASGIAALLLWQAMFILLFLPLTFFSQAALAFLVSVLLGDLLLAYRSHRLPRRVILADFSAFFVLAVVILALNQWKP